MRTRRKGLALALAALAVLSVAGCVQPPAHVIPTSEPSSKPVFASNAAALAAAKKAYVAYLAVSDQVAVDGGEAPGRFAAVVTKSWLSKETASATALAKTQRKQVGATSAVDITLQQRSQHGRVAFVSIYACLDLSTVQYVDAITGLNPSSPATSLIPVEVDMTSSPLSARKLLVERNIPWQGSDFCPQS